MKFMTLIDRLKELRKRYGLLNSGLLRRGDISEEDLTEIEEKYIEGIARALGVPPEYIRKDIAKKWAEHFAMAFIAPEYWPKVIPEMAELTASEARRLATVAT